MQRSVVVLHGSFADVQRHPDIVHRLTELAHGSAYNRRNRLAMARVVFHDVQRSIGYLPLLVGSVQHARRVV